MLIGLSCLYIYIYTYVHIYTHIIVHVYIYVIYVFHDRCSAEHTVSLIRNIYIYIYIYICTHIRVSIYMYIYTYIYIYIHVYIYICIHTCVYMCIYVCIFNFSLHHPEASSPEDPRSPGDDFANTLARCPRELAFRVCIGWPSVPAREFHEPGF